MVKGGFGTVQRRRDALPEEREDDPDELRELLPPEEDLEEDPEDEELRDGAL